MAASLTTLATDFARRLAERDNPPPPAPLSQEPAAIEGRISDWLRTSHRVRSPRSQHLFPLMLLALMQHPELTTRQLADVAGQPSEPAAARNMMHLRRLGIIESYYRGRIRYHRLSRAAEDALLLVVAGPQVS